MPQSSMNGIASRTEARAAQRNSADGYLSRSFQPLRWLTLVLALAVSSPALAQETLQQSAPRTSQKVELAGGSSVEPQRARAEDVQGETYVSLASGHERVLLGLEEPDTIEELRAIERQQSLVAKSLEQVTVNVQQGSAQGSGVIITPDGYILTAAHVAGGPDREAWVLLSDGTRVRARTLGMNRDKDAGLIKIVESRATPWPHATLGKSKNLREGQWVVAAGHPGGWKPGRGSVIRVGRVLKIKSEYLPEGGRAAHTLFTDCALIGGDSGGPLFTLDGKLVGIHSRIGVDVSDNMHVPVDVFDSSWNRMIRKDVWGMLPGYQPVIGVSGTQGDRRPLIAAVVPGGPAHRAGLKAGDLILKFDGVKIATFDELRMGVEHKMPGDTVDIVIDRDGQVLRAAVVIGVAEPK